MTITTTTTTTPDGHDEQRIIIECDDPGHRPGAANAITSTLSLEHTRMLAAQCEWVEVDGHWTCPACQRRNTRRAQVMGAAPDALAELTPTARRRALDLLTGYADGDHDIDAIGATRTDARAAYDAATVAALIVAQVATEAGMPQAEAARRAEVDRMYLRRHMAAHSASEGA